MKVSLLHPVFMLIPIAFSLLASCRLSSELNQTPTIELTTNFTETPTKAPISVRIPKEYLPFEEFSGYYTASFEVSSFVPCSENDLPGYGRGYWIDWGRSSNFYEKYSTLIVKNETEEANVIVFAHFIGKLSNPLYEPYSNGEHRGHMGLYKQEVVVTELIEMKAIEGNECITTK